MNWIERFFLRAKHWQIFLLLVAVFVALEILFSGGLVSGAKSEEDLTLTIDLIAALTGLSLVCFLVWLWSLGSFLTSAAPAEFRLKTGFFRFAVIYPGVYIFVFAALFFSMNPKVLAVIIPLHLFGMFCMFYDLYFVAKSLAMAETGSSATFAGYAGAFFLLWFYPIGIWFIQPRVNRLYADRAKSGIPVRMVEV
jgi:hypothetical protein